MKPAPEERLCQEYHVSSGQVEGFVGGGRIWDAAGCAPVLAIEVIDRKFENHKRLQVRPRDPSQESVEVIELFPLPTKMRSHIDRRGDRSGGCNLRCEYSAIQAAAKEHCLRRCWCGHLKSSV